MSSSKRTRKIWKWTLASRRNKSLLTVDVIKHLPRKRCVICSLKFKRRNAAHKICDSCKQPHKCICSLDCTQLVKGLKSLYAHGHSPNHGMAGKKQTAKQKRAVSKAMKGKEKSIIQKLKQSIAMKGKLVGKKNGFYGKHHPKWLLKQIGNKIKGRISTFKGHHHTKATKELASIRMIERLKNGFIPYTRAVYTRGKVKVWMRSTWEVAFANWLDKYKLTWDYEPDGFKTSRGRYLPDFFVHEWHSFVEIKGAKIKAAMQKLKAFKREYPQFKLKTYDGIKLRRIGVLK